MEYSTLHDVELSPMRSMTIEVELPSRTTREDVSLNWIVAFCGKVHTDVRDTGFVHTKPLSTVQFAEQPSPLIRFPSSQSSAVR